MLKHAFSVIGESQTHRAFPTSNLHAYTDHRVSITERLSMCRHWRAQIPWAQISLPLTLVLHFVLHQGAVCVSVRMMQAAQQLGKLKVIVYYCLKLNDTMNRPFWKKHDVKQ